MAVRAVLVSTILVGLSILLLRGGSVGCGGGVPAVASTLEGTYDCIDGCTGTCTFDDNLEIILGERHAVDDYTGLHVSVVITTAINIFDETIAGAARDDGRFGFVLAESTGAFNMECEGPPVADDEIVIDCKATEEIEGSVIETTCQQATYLKQTP